MSVEVKTNLKPLNIFIKNLKKPIGIKIGILGNTNAREGNDGLTNAEVGVKQEFGSISENIPARSFLRMPLEKKGQQIQEAFTRPDVQKQMLAGEPEKALELIGAVAVGIIDDAFRTSGFGEWKPNSPVTIAKKKSSKPLIDTRQLEQSITYQVVKK